MIPMDDRECVVAECEDCPRIVEMMWILGAPVRVCSTYLMPRIWWNRGGCPFLLKKSPYKTEVKQRVGQQKQKKRG